MTAPYEPPSPNKDAYNCAHCQAYAQQIQGSVGFAGRFNATMQSFAAHCCSRCSRYSVWYDGRLVFPAVFAAPPPAPEMPADVLADYEEARAIVAVSPRGASALLRLAIQRLCISLDAGSDLNKAIGTLVRRGLPAKVQQALDVVRVIGNNAVHPGQIDLNDNRELADSLFGLVNLITDVMVAQPKHIEALYGGLPSSAREAIDQRDGNDKP